MRLQQVVSVEMGGEIRRDELRILAAGLEKEKEGQIRIPNSQTSDVT